MKINRINIGQKFKPFIVAELSGNHCNSFDRALRLVEEAARSGASAIKLQTFTPDTMTLNLNNSEFVIKEKTSLWRGYKLYDLYKKAQTKWKWHKKIFEKAKSLGIVAFSTPFDETAVDFLEELNVPCYKISSFEVTDFPLLKKVALTKKPVIMSTGMASFKEIQEAINVLKKNGTKNIVLLKCTSSYPSKSIDLNIKTLIDMKKKFNCEVGLSDHSLGIGAAVAAISFGACIIEKHFTLKKRDGGIDSAFSLDPAELRLLVRETKSAWESLGKISYGASNSERGSLKIRRSIYVSKKIKKGELFSKENIKIIRPGYGLKPKHFEKIIGKRSNYNIKIGSPLKKNMVKNFKL